MELWRFSTLVVLLFCAHSSESANILFYFGVSTYSHRIIVWPLVETLAARGHNVTFLSPYPTKELDPNQNVTEMAPTELTDFMTFYLGQESDMILERTKGNHRAVWNLLPFLGTESCKVFLGIPWVKEWIHKNHFDLVVIDGVSGECGMGLAHKWGSRVMIYKTSTVFPWEYDLLGIPVESSWIPDPTYHFDQDMPFWKRVFNSWLPVYNYLYHRWVYHPQLEAILRSGLDMPNMPPMYDLFGNVSLVLMNADYTTDYARSLPPLHVQVPGMLMYGSKVKQIPEEMLRFVESAADGFIYFSFGTAAPLKFLVKYELDQPPPEMSQNVFTAKWMPQQSILRHPKCRGFITHGGLGGIHEAVAYGVPLIVMPIFADQDYNAERIARIGHGIKLEILTLKQSELESAIKNITQDPSFKVRSDELSTSLKDRQNNPLETAVWWTEKVLRSSTFDLSLLRPLGRNQQFFVRRSLDTFLFMFLLTLSPIVILILVLKRFLNCTKKQKEEATSHKNCKKDKKI